MDSHFHFGCSKRVQRSVPVLFHGIEAAVGLTLILLKCSALVGLLRGAGDVVSSYKYGLK